ncbi:hypothetical protein MY5147_001385 [Beauveria neobassiana]|uniref:D-xylose 1-dehydrogenase (NADP(+), D-xylono-1,5-lactone-forming) n=1 Tax=Beauveria bassiana TaxID=176275 RepID=A0A2S7YLJ1_BEABA|nr:hypothetical protein BB8028_0007g02590 [Beauveria bassiana]
MPDQTPFTVKWGILATGGIAETFCRDLLCDPAVRDVHDVRHEIAAVASSSSAERAASFVQKINGPSTAKTYGSYAELVADPDVDVIYVATPHSHHFQNAMLALDAGKNVLCEKALTVTAAQTKKLVAKAKEKNLFLMEAVWTRYFPLSINIRELITSGAIGRVHRTVADLAFADGQDDGSVKYPDTNRMVNLDLAGGALLDLGIYALTWVFQTLYHLQQDKESPNVLAAIDQYRTGADETTSIICHFPKNKMTGIATTSIKVATDPNNLNSAGPAIRIQGTKGEIQVFGPAFRPTQYKVIRQDDSKVDIVDCPIPKDPKVDYGHGMFWEADECARCLRDGRKESETLPLSESIVIMETMDSALQQGNIKYPELIATDIFDPKSPLNAGNK